MAVEKETQFEAWLEENMPEPGDNPNYVETITGTLANPFGDYNIANLAVWANVDNTVNMYMVADAGAIGLLAYPLSWLKPLNDTDLGKLFFGASYLPQSGNNLVAEVQYTSDGLSRARIMMASTITDMEPYAESITTTLTIIHHPLPEN